MKVTVYLARMGRQQSVLKLDAEGVGRVVDEELEKALAEPQTFFSCEVVGSASGADSPDSPHEIDRR